MNSPKEKKARTKITLGKILLAMGLLVVLLIVGWIFTNVGRAPRPGVPLFPVNEKANFITTPLDENGDVDYLEYVNATESKGVTPDNNFAIKLVEAIGPNPQGVEVPNAYFERLGMERPDAENEYLVDFTTWFSQSNPGSNPSTSAIASTSDIQNYTMDQQWTSDQFPEFKKHLDDCQPHLAQIEIGLQRPFYYSPNVISPSVESAPVISVLIPYSMSTRQIGRTLISRSNLNWGEGRIKSAIDDAILCQRLGEKVAQSNTMVEKLIAIAIQGMAVAQLNAIARSSEIELDDLKYIQEQAAKFETKIDFKTTIDQGERVAGLDAIQWMFRNSREGLPGIAQGGFTSQLSAMVRLVDPESTMIVLNEWYDKIVVALEQESDAEKLTALRAMSEDLQDLQREMTDPWNAAFEMLAGRRARGRLVGKVMVALLMPAADAVLEAAIRTRAGHELLKLTVAIEIFRKEQGRLPTALQELVPGQLGSIPNDPFTNKPFRFVLEGDDFRIYSMGVDGIDDDGNGPLTQVGQGDDWELLVDPKMSLEEYLNEY